MKALTERGAERQEIHRRTIEMAGYQLPGGLFEVEARLVDSKPFDITLPFAGKVVPGGDPIHDLKVVLTFDEDMVVKGVRTGGSATPYQSCAGAGESLQELVGLRMSRGWNDAVRRHLRRFENCTHFVGLLGPMATTAFQALGAIRKARALEVDVDGRPLKLDSCYAYAANRDVVAQAWPQFYTGEKSGEQLS